MSQEDDGQILIGSWKDLIANFSELTGIGRFAVKLTQVGPLIVHCVAALRSQKSIKICGPNKKREFYEYSSARQTYFSITFLTTTIRFAGSR